MTTKKAAPKRKKKQEVEQEEVLDLHLNTNLAFSRAAVYLEEAGEVAVNSRNIEGMLTVAKGWMELGDMMDPGQPPKKRATLGFAVQQEGEESDGRY
jgi:hypothetical protein